MAVLAEATIGLPLGSSHVPGVSRPQAEEGEEG